MGAVPARVAGVRRVILCSPPGADGRPAAIVLAAAALAGVSEVFALGGAGAIAAMAYGTRSIAPVRRIVGPGNAYVAEAKLQVSGITGIDSPAGPSELLVIADDSAKPSSIAREMLAQAEHDPRAAVVVVALSERARARDRTRDRSADRERAASCHHRRVACVARGAALDRFARERNRVRERIRARASAARVARARRGARAGSKRRHRIPRRHQLGGVRRLHDGRKSRAADRRPRTLVLRVVDARLRALDHVSARFPSCGI